MADSISYTPTTWADGADGGTPITAARLNNIESGVTAATKQANTNAADIKTLGDSVSQKVSVLSSGNAISAAEVYSTDDNPVTIRLTLENGRTAYLYSKADGTVFGRMDS